MNISAIIHGWVNCFRSRNLNPHLPAFLPLTAEEVHEVKRNAIFYSPYDAFDPGAPPSIYGMPVHETPFAVEQRDRQLTVPFLRLEESKSISGDFRYWECVEHMRMHIVKRVCAETTALKLTFEWDCWAGFKRALRIVRWFPIRTRTVLVDGRVLYPYLKVGLPHNRHSVQFKIAGTA